MATNRIYSEHGDHTGVLALLRLTETGDDMIRSIHERAQRGDYSVRDYAKLSNTDLLGWQEVRAEAERVMAARGLLTAKPAVPWNIEADQSAKVSKVAQAATLDEVFDILEMSPVSPEAYYVEIMWLALGPQQ